jgi:hypothetical protein
MTIENYAVIDNSGNVVNVILWDGIAVYNEPNGYQLVLDATSMVGIGWSYDGTNFIPPIVDSNG